MFEWIRWHNVDEGKDDLQQNVAHGKGKTLDSVNCKTFIVASECIFIIIQCEWKGFGIATSDECPYCVKRIILYNFVDWVNWDVVYRKLLRRAWMLQIAIKDDMREKFLKCSINL